MTKLRSYLLFFGILMLVGLCLGAIPSTVVDDANRNKQVRAVAIIDETGAQTGTSTNALPVAIFDEDGNQTGTSTNALPVAIFDEAGNQVGTSTAPLNVKLGDQSGKAAFGEFLVASLHPLFQGSFEYTVDNTDLNTNLTRNSGSVTQVSGMASVGTGITADSTALFETKQHGRYRAGLGGVDRFTGLFGTPTAGTQQFIGLADGTSTTGTFANGYMVGYDGTTFGFHRWQNSSTTTVAQASWDDPLDGTGLSGMTIDQTKLNVFFIQYQYLGAGAIRLFVEDDDTGMPVLVNTIDYVNQNTEPSVHNPNFHHIMYVQNAATTSDITVRSSSYMYAVEGKTEFIELHRPINSSSVREKESVTGQVAIFTIRNRETYAAKTNFIDIIMLKASGSIEASSANNLGNIRIIKNGTLGGAPSYADINTNNSVIEIDVAGTTVSGGTIISATLLAGKNDKFNESLIDDKIILNPGDTISVVGSSTNSAVMDGLLTWKELFFYQEWIRQQEVAWLQ